MQQTLVAPPFIPVGRIKTFGPNGPKYEVGKPVKALPDGDWSVEVIVLETGERAEYRLTHLLDDPDAR